MHKNLKTKHLTITSIYWSQRFDPKVKWMARWWMETDTAQRLADGDLTVDILLPISDLHMDLERESY